jgi:cobalamin biosynthesis protein CobD/CbiB
MMDFLTPGYILAAAFMLDLIFGDPRRLPHPVRWMGGAIAALEPHFRRISANPVVAGAGYAAFLIVGTWLLTLAAIAVLGRIHPLLGSGLEIVLIFFASQPSPWNRQPWRSTAAWCKARSIRPAKKLP